MPSIPKKPAGSTIEERDDIEALTLFWKLPDGGIARYVAIGVLAVSLFGWALGEGFAIHEIAKNKFWDSDIVSVGIWLTLWTFGGGYGSWMLFKMLRPSRDESITLGFHELTYDPGSFSRDVFCVLGLERGHTDLALAAVMPLRWKKPIIVDRTDISEFVLNRAGERQRLTFDVGADRIEIGAYLREPEREWLFLVLEDWRRK